jgi:hypothetical protein
MQTPFHGSLSVKDSARYNLIFPLYSTSLFKFDNPFPQGIYKEERITRIGMDEFGRPGRPLNQFWGICWLAF